MANRIRWTFKLKIASTSSATGLCASGALCTTEGEDKKKTSKIQPNCRLWWLRANNKCELNTHCWHSCHTFWALFVCLSCSLSRFRWKSCAFWLKFTNLEQCLRAKSSVQTDSIARALQRASIQMESWIWICEDNEPHSKTKTSTA